MVDRLEPHESFPSTDWSAVGKAGRDDEASRKAMASLLTCYLPALRAYLVAHRHIDHDRAEEFVQGFIASRVLEQDLISRADPGRGRFRSLLLASLKHYVSNCIRHDRRHKRHPGVILALDEIDSPAVQAPGDAFDLAWAREAIAEALRRMERECLARGRENLWGIFHGRVVAPAIEGATPLPYDQIIQQYAFRSPSEATNALVTAKRMFARTLRGVVGEYARSRDEADEEIRQLKAILARERRIAGPAV